MKLPKRRMIAVILITAVIFVVVKTWVDNQIEPVQYSFIKDNPRLSIIEISPEGKNSYIIKDEKTIAEIQNCIKRLGAGKRVTNNTFQDNVTLTIGYNGDKGQEFRMDKDQNLYTFYRKVEIAQKSKLSYICWKINKLYDNDHFIWYKVKAGTELKKMLTGV